METNMARYINVDDLEDNIGGISETIKSDICCKTQIDAITPVVVGRAFTDILELLERLCDVIALFPMPDLLVCKEADNNQTIKTEVLNLELLDTIKWLKKWCQHYLDKGTLEAYQEKIDDLGTIRSGAQKGSTAVQSITGEQLILEDYAQPIISDIEDIRSGAQKGSTALQPNTVLNTVKDLSMNEWKRIWDGSHLGLRAVLSSTEKQLILEDYAQPIISDLKTIRSNAENGNSAYNQLPSYVNKSEHSSVSINGVNLPLLSGNNIELMDYLNNQYVRQSDLIDSINQTASPVTSNAVYNFVTSEKPEVYWSENILYLKNRASASPTVVYDFGSLVNNVAVNTLKRSLSEISFKIDGNWLLCWNGSNWIKALDLSTLQKEPGSDPGQPSLPSTAWGAATVTEFDYNSTQYFVAGTECAKKIEPERIQCTQLDADGATQVIYDYTKGVTAQRYSGAIKISFSIDTSQSFDNCEDYLTINSDTGEITVTNEYPEKSKRTVSVKVTITGNNKEEATKTCELNIIFRKSGEAPTPDNYVVYARSYFVTNNNVKIDKSSLIHYGDSYINMKLNFEFDIYRLSEITSGTSTPATLYHRFTYTYPLFDGLFSVGTPTLRAINLDNNSTLNSTQLSSVITTDANSTYFSLVLNSNYNKVKIQHSNTNFNITDLNTILQQEQPDVFSGKDIFVEGSALIPGYITYQCKGTYSIDVTNIKLIAVPYVDSLTTQIADFTPDSSSTGIPYHAYGSSTEKPKFYISATITVKLNFEDGTASTKYEGNVNSIESNDKIDFRINPDPNVTGISADRKYFSISNNETGSTRDIKVGISVTYKETEDTKTVDATFYQNSVSTNRITFSINSSCTNLIREFGVQTSGSTEYRTTLDVNVNLTIEAALDSLNLRMYIKYADGSTTEPTGLWVSWMTTHKLTIPNSNNLHIVFNNLQLLKDFKPENAGGGSLTIYMYANKILTQTEAKNNQLAYPFGYNIFNVKQKYGELPIYEYNTSSETPQNVYYQNVYYVNSGKISYVRKLQPVAGHAFKHWNTSEDGSGTIVQAGKYTGNILFGPGPVGLYPIFDTNVTTPSTQQSASSAMTEDEAKKIRVSFCLVFDDGPNNRYLTSQRDIGLLQVGFLYTDINNSNETTSINSGMLYVGNNDKTPTVTIGDLLSTPGFALQKFEMANLSAGIRLKFTFENATSEFLCIAGNKMVLPGSSVSSNTLAIPTIYVSTMKTYKTALEIYDAIKEFKQENNIYKLGVVRVRVVVEDK